MSSAAARAGGDAFQLTATWVSVPDLGVQADGQRYDLVSADHDQRVIRYEAVDGSFRADIRVDRDGIVMSGASYVHPLGQRPVVSASITRSCARMTRPMNGASGRQ